MVMEVPNSERKRKNVLYLVLSDAEMSALEEIAFKERRRPQEAARELIRQEAQRRKIWSTEKEKEEA
jgi:hypothetical protein